MKRKGTSVLTALLLCALALLGALNPPRAHASGLPSLVVTGDVVREVVLTGCEGWETVKIEYRGAVYDGVPLLSVLAQAEVCGEQVQILLAAHDGVVAALSLDEITQDCCLFWHPENRWQFTAPDHPPQARVKDLEYVVVIGTGPEVPGVRIIHGLEESTVTYGTLFTADALQRLIKEGEARRGDCSVTAFTKRSLIPLGQFVGGAELPAALAYFADGSQLEVPLDGFLEWRGRSGDYLGPDGRTRRPDLKGLWLDPPELSVTQLLPAALQALETGRVLIVLLDGLGYYELIQVQPPFLGSKQVQRARTVFPSITPVALASLLTGELPPRHGITARGQRELQVPDLFARAAELGKDSVMVEGTTKVVNTSISPVLNADLDGDGTTDGEIFRAAQEELARGADLVFVHFHGYDDVAHSCGPFSPEAAAKLLELDAYVEDLCQGFTGTVFVLADHGQHPAAGDKLGDHGQFSLLDLTIPWLKWEQP